MPDDFPVTGRIAQRWHSQRSADGPFGRPLAPEEEVPGRNGRRQRFEHGEIAFSPDQDMVVSVFRLRNEACFQWEPTGFRYNYFRYDVIWNGIHQGQQNRQLRGVTLIWTRLQGFGEYAFVVKGCHEFSGGDECNEGLTIPVRVQLGLYTGTPDPSEFPVNGLIAERWHELGAWDGPLGVTDGAGSTGADREPSRPAVRTRLDRDAAEIRPEHGGRGLSTRGLTRDQLGRLQRGVLRIPREPEAERQAVLLRQLDGRSRVDRRLE